MANEAPWVADWETGNRSQWEGIECQDLASQAVVQTAVKRQGSYAGQLSVVGAQGNNYGGYGSRVLCRQILGSGAGQDERRGQDYYYTMSRRFPSNLQTSTCLLWEIHQKDDLRISGYNAVAPLALTFHPDKMEFRRNTGQASGGNWGAGVITTTIPGLEPLPRNVWVDVIVHVYYHENGLVEIWHRTEGGNDFPTTPQFTFSGPTIMWINSVTEDHSYYMLDGIYRGETTGTTSYHQDACTRQLTKAAALAVFGSSGGGGSNPPPPPTDPNTVEVSVDGYVRASENAYPPTVLAWNPDPETIYVGRSLNVSVFNIDTLLLELDTGALLPDNALVTAATLAGHVVNAGSGDGRSLVGEWYAGSMGTSGHVANLPNADAFDPIPISQIVAGQIRTINLTNVASISPTAVTRLRLQVSGGQPAGANYVGFAALEHSSLPAFAMTITYTTQAGGGGGGGGSVIVPYQAGPLKTSPLATVTAGVKLASSFVRVVTPTGQG